MLVVPLHILNMLLGLSRSLVSCTECMKIGIGPPGSACPSDAYFISKVAQRFSVKFGIRMGSVFTRLYRFSFNFNFCCPGLNSYFIRSAALHFMQDSSV